MAGIGRPVAIVGGGISGLACADRLTAAGLPWVLLEREHRLGGRVRTITDRGARLDLGPKAFNPRGRALSTLLVRLGLTEQTQPLPGERGVALSTPAGTVLLGPGGVEGGGLTSRQRSAAGRYLTQAIVAPVGGGPWPRPTGQTPITRSWAAELRQHVDSEVIDAVFRPLAFALALAAPDAIPAAFAREALRALTGPLARPTGGFERLVAALWQRHRHTGQIHTDADVRRVRRDGEGYQLILSSGASVRAEQVVLAHPLGRYRMARQTVLRGRQRSGSHALQVTLGAARAVGLLLVRLSDEHLALIRPAHMPLAPLVELACEPGARTVPLDRTWSGPLRYAPVIPPAAVAGTPASDLVHRCGDGGHLLGLEGAVRTGVEVAERVITVIRGPGHGL